MRTQRKMEDDAPTYTAPTLREQRARLAKVPTVAQLYRQFRAENDAYWPGGAVRAMRRAKATRTMLEARARFPINVPDYCGMPAEITALPGGFALRVAIVADDDYRDMSDIFGDAYAIEKPNCSRYGRHVPPNYGAGDGWVSREGVIWIDTDPHGVRHAWHTFEPQHGGELSARIASARKHGASRGVAFELARASLQRESDALRERFRDNGGMCGYIVTLLRDGVEVAEDSLWGIDDEEYARDEARGAARWLVREALGMLAKEDAAGLARVAELRKLEAHDARAVADAQRILQRVDAEDAAKPAHFGDAVARRVALRALKSAKASHAATVRQLKEQARAAEYRVRAWRDFARILPPGVVNV